MRLIRPSGPLSDRLIDFKVFGPTCDSNDVLGAPFLLPADTREGDWIEVDMMGAYSLSMRTRFNGFHTDRIVAVTSCPAARAESIFATTRRAFGQLARPSDAFR